MICMIIDALLFEIWHRNARRNISSIDHPPVAAQILD
jgi:hypothetical protein